MKENEFKNVMDTIYPKQGVKETIWENVNSFQKHSSLKKTWSYLVASLVLVCLVIYSVPVIAAEIRTRLLQEMPSYKPLEEQIETNIFSKSDNHIQITVDELLSDGMGVYMLAHYTALDDFGRQWLSDYTSTSPGYDPLLNLQPYIEDYSVNATNYSFKTFEQMDLATENERYFILSLETSGRDYTSNKGILRFPMTEQNENTIIDIGGNVEVLSFALHSEGNVSELYEPTYMEISPMSFVVYAKNFGVYERIEDSEKWMMPDEELNLLEKSVYLIMEDGSKHPIISTSSCTTTPKETNYHSDLVLLSGFFKDYNNVSLEEPILINPQKVIGIEIKGVIYSITK